MKRLIRRSLRWSLVVTLATFLSTGPAAAGWLHRHLHACPPEPCCTPTPTHCAPAPVCCSEPVYSPPVDNCCQSDPCCGGVTVDGMSVLDGGPIDLQGSTGYYEESVPSKSEHDSSDEHQDADSENSTESEDDGMKTTATDHDDAADAAEDVEDNGASVAPPAPTPPQSEPAPKAEPKADADANADDLNLGSGEPSMELPGDTQAITPKPLAPVPAIPPADASAPTDASADDLFGGAGEPATTEPTPKPAEAESIDDLFGAPADDSSARAETAPAMENTPVAPADADSSDDLFGGDSGFGATDPAMPADNAGENADDLFGAPAEEPAKDSSENIEDLFGDPAAQPDASKPATPKTPTDDSDDLFSDPPAENSDGGALEDLFSNWGGNSATAQNEVADVEPSRELATQPVADANAADANAQGAEVLDSLTGLDNTELRTWVDNTGGFRTEGRLIKIGEDYVKLRKNNGKTCTVPISRLSQEDSEYVQSIVQRVALFVMAAPGR